jgi:hypothetical protein
LIKELVLGGILRENIASLRKIQSIKSKMGSDLEQLIGTEDLVVLPKEFFE